MPEMYRTCPLCSGTRNIGIDIVEDVERVGRNVLCETCGLIYHNPVADYGAAARFYQVEYAESYKDSEEIARGQARQRLHFLQRHVPITKLGPALEIGCAHGLYLQQLREQGVACSGIEPSSVMAATGRREHGLEIVSSMYEEVPERTGFYASVHMFHVLEHILDPLETLRRIRREIKRDGLLYLAVPTLGAPQLAMVFKAIHCTVFVADTLQAMLQKAGFKAEVVHEAGYNIHVLARPCDSAEQRSWPDAQVVLEHAGRYLAIRESIVRRMRTTLDGLKGCKNIALYGAGHNSLDLASIYPLDRLDISGVYDADPAKAGRELFGHVVQPPDNLHGFSGDAVIVSSYAFQEEIIRQQSYLRERGVALVTLYDKEKGAL